MHILDIIFCFYPQFWRPFFFNPDTVTHFSHDSKCPWSITRTGTDWIIFDLILYIHFLFNDEFSIHFTHSSWEIFLKYYSIHFFGSIHSIESFFCKKFPTRLIYLFSQRLKKYEIPSKNHLHPIHSQPRCTTEWFEIYVKTSAPNKINPWRKSTNTSPFTSNRPPTYSNEISNQNQLAANKQATGNIDDSI